MESEFLDTNNQKPGQDQQPQPPQTKLVDVQITNENMALNVIISFVSLAQKRGIFTLEESAKIWECIKKFQKP
jgi:hypothetical protein